MSTSLQKIPGISQTTIDFVAVVREYMRDHAELNRLVAGHESSDRQILWAIATAVEQFNGTPPFTVYTLEDLLQYRQHMLLIEMVDIILMKGIVRLQMRNHINYSTGGTSVGVTDKSPLLLKWLDRQQGQVEQMLQRVKVALNIQSILGSGESGAFSEYWAVNGSYATFG